VVYSQYHTSSFCCSIYHLFFYSKRFVDVFCRQIAYFGRGYIYPICCLASSTLGTYLYLCVKWIHSSIFCQDKWYGLNSICKFLCCQLRPSLKRICPLSYLMSCVSFWCASTNHYFWIDYGVFYCH